MRYLEQGQKIKTIAGEDIIIIRFIAHGGRGAVYKVLFRDEYKVLKWYDGQLGNEQKLYENLRRQVKRGTL